MQLDMILVGQNDVAERERDMTRGQEFFLARRKTHGCAGVDKDVGEEVHFLAKQLDVEPVAASINAPVEIAQVVARRIAAVVGEFQTGAAARRRIAARMAAKELFARAQPQGFELGQKGRRERVRQHAIEYRSNITMI